LFHIYNTNYVSKQHVRISMCILILVNQTESILYIYTGPPRTSTSKHTSITHIYSLNSFMKLFIYKCSC